MSDSATSPFYHLVEWEIEEGDFQPSVSIVPDNWLVLGTDTCRWPRHATSNIIRRNVEPRENWATFKYRRIVRSSVNFDKVKRWEDRSLDKTDVETTDDEVNSTRKRTAPAHWEYYENHTDSPSPPRTHLSVSPRLARANSAPSPAPFQATTMPLPPPRSPAPLQATTMPVPPPRSPAPLQATTMPVPPPRSPAPLQATTMPVPPPRSPAPLQATTMPVPPPRSPAPLQATSLPVPSASSSSPPRDIDNCSGTSQAPVSRAHIEAILTNQRKMMNFFGQQQAEIQALRNQVRRVEAMVLTLTGQEGRETRDAVIEGPELPNGFEFPLQATEEVDRLNEVLANPVIAKQLERYLFNLGGSTFKESIRLMGARLLSPEVQGKYSRTGTSTKAGVTKASFEKLSHLCLVLFKATNGRHHTDLQIFKSYLGEWLATFRDRMSGGKKNRLGAGPLRQLDNN